MIYIKINKNKNTKKNLMRNKSQNAKTIILIKTL